ncbi:MAG TPA: hypothetical protein VHF51_14365, partial [Solirubrobacteraceae bacterium]|nr:hypothetical protein [Solirubrobacteraceae bacterium]
PARVPVRVPVRVPAAPHRAGAPAAEGASRPVPALAWGGLVVLAAGLPVGGLVRRGRRRRAGIVRGRAPVTRRAGWLRL